MSTSMGGKGEADGVGGVRRGPRYRGCSDPQRLASLRLPLVLLRGHPFDRTMWYPQLARHHGGPRMIAPDLRGYADSGAGDLPPGAAVTQDVLAADVAALLDRLGVDEILSCGLSMGGQVAMAFHHRYPGRVRGLLLASTSARADAPDGRRSRWPTLPMAAASEPPRPNASSATGSARTLASCFPGCSPAQCGERPGLALVRARHDAHRTAPHRPAGLHRLPGAGERAGGRRRRRGRAPRRPRPSTSAPRFPTPSWSSSPSAGHLPDLEDPPMSATAIERQLALARRDRQQRAVDRLVIG